MRSPKQHRCSLRSPRPLHLLVLEDRCLLSTYTITDLGPDTFATGVNNLGQVAGYTSDASFSPLHAFLWDNGTFTDLGTVGGATSQALGINDTGQVVGLSEISPQNHVYHAFLWDSTNGMQDLGTFGGFSSAATAINNSGQMVGYVTNGQAVLWSDGQMIALSPQGATAVPYSINNGGQIVGESTQLAGDLHATLWDGNGGVVDLGTIGSDFESYAYGINDAGQVVGQSAPNFRAFLWQDGTLTDLLPGVNGPAGATAINNAGQIVGFDPGAFIYGDGQEAHLQDLIPPDSGLSLLTPRAINDAGQIAGEALDGDRVYHAVLLTPQDGASPRGSVDPGISRLTTDGPTAASPAEILNRAPTSALGEPARAEGMVSSPADATLRCATDILFSSSHQIHTPSLDDGLKVEGLELGLVPPFALTV
jgi:probable HAF family extracellular repeat protein